MYSKYSSFAKTHCLTLVTSVSNDSLRIVAIDSSKILRRNKCVSLYCQMRYRSRRQQIFQQKYILFLEKKIVIIVERGVLSSIAQQVPQSLSFITSCEATLFAARPEKDVQPTFGSVDGALDNSSSHTGSIPDIIRKCSNSYVLSKMARHYHNVANLSLSGPNSNRIGPQRLLNR